VKGFPRRKLNVDDWVLRDRRKDVLDANKIFGGGFYAMAP